ncbi:uncharacterized protein [Physcomitrium patens]|uniref:uncharacterized protein n=1 Tax=Physcomitrium patens TaxID=3218 RepID=UPI003CCC97C1
MDPPLFLSVSIIRCGFYLSGFHQVAVGPSITSSSHSHSVSKSVSLSVWSMMLETHQHCNTSTQPAVDPNRDRIWSTKWFAEDVGTLCVINFSPPSAPCVTKGNEKRKGV